MNTKKLKLLTIITTIVFTSSINQNFCMEDKPIYCLNIGGGFCIQGETHLRFGFNEKYEGNDFKIISKQENNMIELFKDKGSPVFVINGHAYPPCLKGTYYLKGQDLYEGRTRNLIKPLQSNLTPWNP